MQDINAICYKNNICGYSNILRLFLLCEYNNILELDYCISRNSKKEYFTGFRIVNILS